MPPPRRRLQRPLAAQTTAPGAVDRSTDPDAPREEARRRHTELMNSTTATWPEWKAAKPGQRVRMNRTGSTGTVLNVNRFGVRVQWDESEYAGVVVAPAFDLTAI